MKGWLCRCPEPVEDDAGGPGICRAAAEVKHTYEHDSTSGPLLHCVVVCDVKHRSTVLWEDLDLLG